MSGLGPVMFRIMIKRWRALGWLPKYDLCHVLTSLHIGKDFRGPLTLAVSRKEYHFTVFEAGPWPVAG
jgi:UDP-glucose 4-epimerase